MKNAMLKAVKLQTSNIADCESFFGTVFGFQVVNRYVGNAGDRFEEIVMTLPGGDGMMLKFIQFTERTMPAAGVTIQIRLENIDEVIAAAKAAYATVQMAPTTFPEDGVRMAVLRTDQHLDIELVQSL